MDGKIQTDEDPIWGEKGVFSENNNPGSRSQGAMWNVNNDIYLWGGFGNQGNLLFVNRTSFY